MTAAREGERKVRGGSGLLERRKRKTGVRDFAQQMSKHPQCLLRASGSLLAGKQSSLQHVFNCHPVSHGGVFEKIDKDFALVLTALKLNFCHISTSE